MAIAVNTAAVPLLSTVAGDTDLTPGRLADRVREVGQPRVGGRRLGLLLLVASSSLLLRGLLLRLLLGLLLRGALGQRPAARSAAAAGLSCCSCWSILSSRFWSGLAGSPSSTATSNGPLTPAPKPLVIRS